MTSPRPSCLRELPFRLSPTPHSTYASHKPRAIIIDSLVGRGDREIAGHGALCPVSVCAIPTDTCVVAQERRHHHHQPHISVLFPIFHQYRRRASIDPRPFRTSWTARSKQASCESRAIKSLQILIIRQRLLKGLGLEIGRKTVGVS